MPTDAAPAATAAKAYSICTNFPEGLSSRTKFLVYTVMSMHNSNVIKRE